MLSGGGSGGTGPAGGGGAPPNGPGGAMVPAMPGSMSQMPGWDRLGWLGLGLLGRFVFFFEEKFIKLYKNKNESILEHRWFFNYASSIYGYPL